MSEEKKYSSDELQNVINDILRTHEHITNKDLMKLVNEKLDGVKKIRSIGDLKKKEQEVTKAAGGYGENYVPVDDFEALEESKEKRVKASKKPTTVGKALK